jgi:hypothetical protein
LRIVEREGKAGDGECATGETFYGVASVGHRVVCFLDKAVSVAIAATAPGKIITGKALTRISPAIKHTTKPNVNDVEFMVLEEELPYIALM